MRSEKEWMEQHLASVTPLPFGERTAPRRRWQRGRVWFRARTVGLRRALCAAGTVAAAGGVALMVWPSEVSVSLDGTSYRVGDSRLVGQADGAYRGDGVLVMRRQRDGSISAASSFVHAGQTATGACRVDHRAGLERCTFRFAGRTSVTAVDVYEPGGWWRQYGDGLDVRIAAQTMLPVPFPIGR